VLGIGSPRSRSEEAALARPTIGIAAAIAATAVCASAGPAAAHPHVWVTVESTLLYEQGSIAAIRHKWSFDEFYTSMAVQGLDKNNDGRYERDELAELAKVNMDGLKEFSYFTHVKLADHGLTLADVKDYYLEYEEAAPRTVQGGTTAANAGNAPEAKRENRKVLSLYFTLPLNQPVLADAPGFSFTVADPSFFIAFEFAKTDPIKLGPGAPADCRIGIGDSERDAEDAKRLGEAFFKQMGSQGFGLSLGKPVSVRCGPKS
jgi:ABC-type uncharacterized transport system substrate-binding protein